MAAKTDLKLTIGADKSEADKVLSEFQKEYNELTDSIKKPLGDIAAFVQMKKALLETGEALKAAEKECAEYAAKLKATKEPSNALVRSFEAAKAKAGALKESLHSQRAALQNLRDSLTGAGVNTAALAFEQIRLKRSLQATEAASQAQARAALRQAQAEKELADAYRTLGVRPLHEIQGEVSKLETAYRTLKRSGSASLAELAQAKLKVAEKTRELEAETSRWVDVLSKAQGGIAALAGSAAGLTLAVTAARNFESAMSDVGKVVDAPEEKMRSLQDAFLGLTRSIPLTAVEIARIAEAGGQMGIVADEIEGFVTATAKIATAFKMSAEEAGETVGKLMNVWHMSVADVASLADSINVLGNELNTTEAKISDVLVRIGAMPKIFGLSARESSALAAAILSLGKTPEVAATAINALLSKLQTANAQTPEFKAALASIGLSARQLAADINEHPQQALLSFLQTLSRLDRQTKSETLVKLFGQEYQDDVSAVVDAIDLYERALSMATNTTKIAGSVDREYGRGMQTLNNQLSLAKNAVTELGIVLGNGLLPIAKGATSAIQGTARALTDLVAISPGLANVVLLVGNVTLALGTLSLVGKATAVILAKMFQPLIAGGVAVRAVLASVVSESAATVSGFGLMKNAASGLTVALGGLASAVAIAGAAWGAWQIGRLAQEMVAAREATGELEAMAERYRKLAKEYEAYRDVKTKGLGKLKKMNAEELQSEAETLMKSLTYWKRHREELEGQSGEENFFGHLTDDARKARAELPKVLGHIEGLQNGLALLGEAARAAGVSIDILGGKSKEAADKQKVLKEQTDKTIDSMRAKMTDLGDALTEYGTRLTSGKISLSEYGTLARKLWNDHATAAKESFEVSSAGLAKWGEETKATFQEQIGAAEETYRKISEEYIKATRAGDPNSERLKNQTEQARKAIGDLRDYAATMSAEASGKVTEMAESNLKHITDLLGNYKAGMDLKPLLQGLDTLKQQGILTGDAIEKKLVDAFEKLKAVNLQDLQNQLENIKRTGGDVGAVLQSVLTSAVHKLGMDTDKYRTELSATEQEMIEAFTIVATNSEAASGTITHALNAILDKVKSLQAIDELRRLLVNLGYDGKFGPEQVANAMVLLDMKTQKAKEQIAGLERELNPLEQAFKDLGVQSAAAMKSAANGAAEAFKIVKNGYHEGKVSLGEYEAAWEAHAKAELDYAKTIGGYREAEIKRRLEAEGAVQGFRKAVEELGLAAKKSGEQGAAGMKAIGDAAKQSAEEIRAMKKAAVEEGAKKLTQSPDAQNSAIREYYNPDTTAERRFELQQQMIKAGVNWDSSEALKVRDEGKGETSSQAPSGFGFSYQIPNWDYMSAVMRARVKAAIKLGNQPGMQEAAKDEERKLREKMEASLSGLERMKERLKKAGSGGGELDEETGHMLEGYVSGARKDLSAEALSELSSAVESWKSRSEQAAREKTEKGKTPEEREPFRTARPAEAKKPGEAEAPTAKVEVKQPERVTVQAEKPVEVRAEPQAGQPIVEVKAPAQAQPQAQPQPQAQTQALMQPQPQMQPPEGGERPPTPPPEKRREEKPDDRPLRTLEEISSTLSRIDQGIQDLIRLSSGGGGGRTSGSATDLTRAVLRTIQEASTRS